MPKQFRDGDIYEGEWFNDKAHGFGIYKHINGAIYEGEWENDQQSGKGKESWPDGSVYTGDFLNGKIKNHFIHFVVFTKFIFQMSSECSLGK